MNMGLSTLLSESQLENFLQAYEAQEPFVVHDRQGDLNHIFELSALSSLDSLLACWPKSIEAHLPDLRDELSAIETTTKDAKKLFQNGMGLLFKEAQTLSPVISELVRKVRVELGLSEMTYGRSLIYATPSGRGTSPHFDQNINLVIQLSGTKRWWMAANEQVIHPMTRFTMGQEVSPEMESYLQAPMPLEMPADAQSFELHAGSVLFVPRGYWHSTEASGDALSLNLTYTAPTWMDILVTALRGRLMQSPEWRETAEGVSDPEKRLLAERKLDYLLSTLKEDLPYWTADDLLSVTEP
jgi:50S ribosomal protein L16 3-hydroxylase